MALGTITLSGHAIPRLGMGCWAIGGPYRAEGEDRGWGEVDDGESIAAIHRAIDLGIRFFDTANVYGAGHSEIVLGKALRGHDDVLVATKFNGVVAAERAEIVGADLTARGIRRAVEASLARLGRERIDLYQLHNGRLPVDEAALVADTLEALVREGKIASFGWSTDLPDRVAAWLGRKGFVAVQHECNLFRPAAEVLALCDKAGLISINRGPLAMGLLTGKFNRSSQLTGADVRVTSPAWLQFFRKGRPQAEFLDSLEKVRALLTDGGRTLAQGALAWIWAKSGRTVPIPGFRNRAQVEENAGALEKGALPGDVVAEIGRLIGTPRQL